MTKKNKPRGKGRITIAVKDAVENCFRKVNDETGEFTAKNGVPYLEWLALNHAPAFVSLIGRCIPQEATMAVSISHKFDLGKAMLEAQDRKAKLIDITPATPVDSTKIPNPLITIDNK